jgi:hypothetical protein
MQQEGGPFKPFFGLSGLALQPKLALCLGDWSDSSGLGRLPWCYCREESITNSKIMDGKITKVPMYFRKRGRSTRDRFR